MDILIILSFLTLLSLEITILSKLNKIGKEIEQNRIKISQLSDYVKTLEKEYRKDARQ